MIKWNKIKRACSFNYRDRGAGQKWTKWHIRHKTQAGLYIINLRKQIRNIINNGKQPHYI